MEIYKEYDSMYILEANGKKIHRFAFMAVFVSYCPPFWDAGVIYMPMALSTYLKGMTKNSSFLSFRAVFMSYCP
jgi:hypothetical protein